MSKKKKISATWKQVRNRILILPGLTVSNLLELSVKEISINHPLCTLHRFLVVSPNTKRVQYFFFLGKNK